MKDNMYTNVAQKTSPIRNNSNQDDKFGVLIEKWEPKNKPKF